MADPGDAKPAPMEANNLAYLRTHFEGGRVVLFAGAGFSIDATNAEGQSPPLGGPLAERLAKEVGHKYGGEPLPTVFSVAAMRMGPRAFNELLTSLYSITGFNEWYGLIPSFVWHRIYTTNVDDLLEKVFAGVREQRPFPIVCPHEAHERDQLLGELQLVHLHGAVTELSKGLTFTFEDFAKQTARSNPWYQTLVDDFFNNPVIFVGTRLEEPPFYHYLELRGLRDQSVSEFRAKAFFVNRSISAIRREQLVSSNIIPVEATAADFFAFLRQNLPGDSTSLERVRLVFRPDLEIRGREPRPDPEVARSFILVLPDRLPQVNIPSDRDVFFLGAEPTWDDMRRVRDAPRVANNEVLKHLKGAHAEGVKCTFIHGSAGSGKTTLMMRVAIELAGSGESVWFARGTERLDLDPVLDLIHSEKIPPRNHFLFIDVAGRHLGALSATLERVRKSPLVHLVLADRTNAYVNKRHALQALETAEYEMPNLASADIDAIIAKLDHFGYLGVLKGKPAEAQRKAFADRAERQILVAMREATSGKGFDDILRSEFSELSEQAQLAYTACAMAVAEGSPGVYRRHLVACMDRSEYSKAAVLDRLLKGVLVPANESGTLVKPRHRHIAHVISTKIVPVALKRAAITRLLLALSGDIVPNEIKRRSPAFLSYRSLVNSEALFRFFGENDVVLGIYADVQSSYASDFLFLMHHGMAHIRAENFDIAENYLNQSLSLRHDNFQAKHQLGILKLIRASRSESPELAQDLAVEGRALLDEQIRQRGMEDSYPFAAYLHHVMKWYVHAGPIITPDEWEALKETAERARNLYGLDGIIKDACEHVNRAYMMRAVKPGPAAKGQHA